jgi:oligosaccharide reducing-end xylanase
MKRWWRHIVAAGLLAPGCRTADHLAAPVGKAAVAATAAVPVARSGNYRNLFREIGKSDAEIDAKIDAAVKGFLYGDDEIRCYYPVGSDEAYIFDSSNKDVRSEGMSYGMMIAVELGLKNEFDRLWSFARRHMRNGPGDRHGYFAWRAAIDGRVLDPNPAPDGEEYFAMSLFFAWKRWGDEAYKNAADDILHHMLHQDRYLSAGTDLTTMIDPTARQIVFVPRGDAAHFTDPSYHLPGFYELYARWASEDNKQWREIAQVSRAYFKTAAHPTTGLFPDYSLFDGTPTDPWKGGHADFRFDAWRVIQNVVMDQYWFGANPWAVEEANRWQGFFASQGITTHGYLFTLDGKALVSDHGPGLAGMNAVASLIATNPHAMDFVRHLWSVEPARGQYRYYDNCLYIFAMLHCSGKYRMIGVEHK